MTQRNIQLGAPSEISAGEMIFPKTWVLWCLGFVYSAIAALVVQKLLLPLMTEMHAGDGLLQNDAIVFHAAALDLSQRILTDGWAEWRLWPGPGLTGNVGLLAALYALLGPDPAWAIPFNAAAQALSAVILYRIGALLWPGSIGNLGGLVAAVLFLVFPSSLQWYGQNHKDAYSIAGALLVLYSIVRGCPGGGRDVLLGWVLSALGILLIWTVRPHFLMILTVALFTSLVAEICLAAIYRTYYRKYRNIILGIGIVLISGVMSVDMPRDRDVSSAEPTAEYIRLDRKETAEWKWDKTLWLPERIDFYLERVTRSRVAFIAHGTSVGAGSQIDAEVMPTNAIQMAAYLPRALWIGLLAPFPKTWIERPSLPRIIGAIETFIAYLLLPGILVLIKSRPSRALLVGIVFSSVMLTILAYAYPNLGNLYRQRFGFWFVFILCGAVGLSSLLASTLYRMEIFMDRRSIGYSKSQINCSNSLDEERSITHVAASGFAVLIISFLTFLGFMVRDLLLLKSFGMAGRLDGLVAAMMIPMFFVTALALPISEAFTASFIRTSQHIRNRLIAATLTVSLAVLGVVSVLLLTLSPWLIDYFGGAQCHENKLESIRLLQLFIPILMFSCWAIIGNAVLNAVNQANIAAGAQLSVPIIAICAIYFFADTHGLASAIIGMLLGQIANICLLVYLLWRSGYILFPGSTTGVRELTQVLRSYGYFSVTAFLIAAAVPINYYFAAQIEPGALTTWAFGSKLVQLFSGIIGVVIGASVMPHVGRLIANKRHLQLNTEIAFMLAFGTALALVVAVAAQTFAEPLIVSGFSGGAVSEEEASRLAAILKLGALQLPFIASSTLLLKVAAMAGGGRRAIGSAIIGLCLNVTLILVLSQQSGVLGLATASVIAAGGSACYLLIATRLYSGLRLQQVIVILISWVSLLGLSIAIHFQSQAATVTAAFALIFVTFVQWNMLRAEVR